MSYTYEEDWIHVDDWEKQVRQYEAEIEDLKLQVKNMAEDEAFILSNLIELRWRYSDYWDMKEELTYLIGLYHAETKKAAYALLDARFPPKDNRTPEERWSVSDDRCVRSST
jgi:hypothetical protein